jgi:hypothetical protein
MKYNYQKHIELLKYNDLLEKQNKFLIDEDKLKYLEMRKYSLQINEHLHWSQKDDYLELIEDFLSFKINGKQFDKKFCSMLQAIEKKSRLLHKNYEILKDIKPSDISVDFGQPISEIYLCCDEFYPDFDEKDPPDFSICKK